MEYNKKQFFHDTKQTWDSYDRGDIDKETRDSQLEQYLEWISGKYPDFADDMRKQYGL